MTKRKRKVRKPKPKKRKVRKPKPSNVPKPRLRGDEAQIVQLLEYKITYEPLEEDTYKRLPRQVKKIISRLYEEAQERPLKVIPELLALLEKYPDVPVLYNYLSMAYSASGQHQKTEEIVEENYRRNPDYLFARINYAELHRFRGDYEQIAEIFDHKFDLKLLYPERTTFHISEVANFMGIIGIYFFEIGNRDMAKRYYDILKPIASEYPVTKLLRNKLHPKLLRRLFQDR